MENSNKTKILVIRASAMGDVAMTAPVLRAMAERYGDRVEMVMLTRDFYEPFFDGITSLSVYDIDLAERHAGVKGIYRLFKELRKTYQFDLVVDLNYKLYSRLLRRFFAMAGIKTYHIDKGRAEKKALTREHDKELTQLKTSIERYADVFRTAGFEIDVPNILPQRIKRAVPDFAGQKNEPWIGIAPFAKHEGKILPLSTIRHTIELLQQRLPQVKIFIFGGGRVERMVADSLVAWFPTCVSAIGRVTLRGELDLIANLDAMVSMDSSAMHMSSLMGVPVVSVWGATHPYAGFLGFGQCQHNVVQSDDLTCRPCSVYGHKECMRKDYACMKTIKAESITERIITIINQTK